MSNNNDCQNNQEVIAALVLGELKPQEVFKIKKHIDSCQTCQSLYQALAEEEKMICSAFQSINDRGEAVKKSLSAQFGKSSVGEATKFAIARKLIKIAAAAVILIGVLFWYNQRQDNYDGISYFSLLSKACAAEQALFFQNGPVHITNEIIVYPVEDKNQSLEVDDSKPQWLKDAETLHSWLDYNWLPMCSVKANGHLRFNQLELRSDREQPYTIIDESWYDSSMGRFARVLKLGERVVFANSYDGQFVYSCEVDANGITGIIGEKVTDNFNPPQNPAEFLGITAGLRSGIDEEDVVLIQEVKEGTLTDGTDVRIVKAGFEDFHGKVNTYWIFRIRSDNDTIAEMEFILLGQPRLLIRRVSSETVAAMDISWNLKELEEKIAGKKEISKVGITPDMVISNVSVQHMIENADYQTYIFASNPAWAEHCEIVDCVDIPSPGHRAFFLAYRAEDGRHVVLVQAHSYNTMLGGFARKGQLVYTSPNGFKVWGGGPDKWYSKILLMSAQSTIKDPPSDERIGYVLESPSGTFPTLAVNGPLTDEELHGLIDSLVPSEEYIKGKSKEK